MGDDFQHLADGLSHRISNSRLFQLMGVSMFECVNCGQENTLGDCCQDCCGRECDWCGDEIPIDEDVTRGEFVFCQTCNDRR